ncbi:MAG: hypothetical protein ACREAM_07275, partial [Blastocatellia bacterium]
VKFQDSLSDYIEGALDPRARAECATHRLICGECRELYNDVRVTVRALNTLGEGAEPEGLRSRIIASTTTGEMLSCGEFDKLLERYFDGVILAPTFLTFQSHFKNCFKCRRLLNGIGEAIEMLRDAKETEVEVPNSLHDRIVAATIGRESASWPRWPKLFDRAQSAVVNFARPLMSPQMAVAAMILAAISLLVISRYGGVSNLTMSAEQKAESLVSQGQQKINSTGAMARSGFQRFSSGVSSFLFSGAAPSAPARSPAPASTRMQPSPQPRPRREADPAPKSLDSKDRDKARRPSNQRER